MKPFILKAAALNCNLKVILDEHRIHWWAPFKMAIKFHVP
jgi:hypothetical protein